MIKFINVARQFPAYYINLIDKQLESFVNEKELPINEDMIYETNEGKPVWRETRIFLQNQVALPPFELHEGLNLSAKDHALDLAEHGMFGHTGSDKSTFNERILKHCRKGQGAMAEIIGADFCLEDRNNAEMTILGLILDDGVADRGHRKTIFNPEYRYIGCKSEIQDDKVVTVFNMTENRLQIRGESNISQLRSSVSQVKSSASYQNEKHSHSNMSNFQSPKKEEKSQANYSKTSANNYAKETPSKGGSKKTVFDDISNVSNRPPSGKGGIISQEENPLKWDLLAGKKVSEKKENTRVIYEEGSKTIEKYSHIYYSDGTHE